MSWSDIVDITIISVLLHRLIVLLRGTAGQNIVAGIFILLGLNWVARTAGLVLTTWLFATLGPALLFAFVVIFRNELREALLQTTPTRLLLLGRGRAPADPILPRLADLAFELAATRTGALIVLQNRDRLISHAREGEVVTARFSPAMIRAVFLKESPVHDGAVILRGDRMDRVGVLLPLSIRPDLPPEYGTRHRAAIGLTERTDAAVIVVSEERGVVSLAHQGRVQVVATPEALVASLRSLWQRSESQPSWRRIIRDFVRQAAGLAAVALLVSLAWWFDPGRQTTLATVEARVEFRNLQDRLVLRHASREVVRVQVKGRRLIVEGLRPDQVRASVDLRGRQEGLDQDIELTPREIELPPNLEIVTIEPDRLRLDIERRERRRLPLQARFRGELPSGAKVEVLRIVPSTLEVVGPASDVAGLTTVMTEAIDLTHLPDGAGERQVAVGLRLEPNSIGRAPGEPEKVEVHLRISPAESDGDRQASPTSSEGQ